MEWSTRKMRSWWDTDGHTRNHGVDHVSGIHFWYINVATYWQFIESGLMPVYLFIDGKHRSCCAILFYFLSACYFWLDAAGVWWFDASSLAERSIRWQWRFLFFLFNWSDFVQVSALSTPYKSAWKLVYGAIHVRKMTFYTCWLLVHDILVTCINNVSQFSCYLLEALDLQMTTNWEKRKDWK